MKTKKSQIFIFALMFIFIIMPFALHAQGTGQTLSVPNPFNCGGANSNGATGCTLLTLVTQILTAIIMPLASVAAVGWLIWAGFQYVLARGNPAEIKKAHDNLLWALIGVGIILGAQGIAAVLQKTVQSLMTS